MEKEEIIIAVCIIYFAAMVLIEVIAARKDKTTSDYLVAGRKLNMTMTAITLAAAQIGVGIVLSSATNGYDLGAQPGVCYVFGYDGGLIIAGLVTTKKLREQEGYTPLDYFTRRYGEGKAIRLWTRINDVPSLLGIFIAQLLASGGILTGFGILFKTGVVVTATVILIYYTMGGMQGVVLADVTQTAIIAVGVPILAMAILIRYVGAGGSIGEIFATPFIPVGVGSRFVYLVSPFLLSISVSCDTYSRIQLSKDAKTARTGYIMDGILVIVISGFCSTIGVAARSLFPGVTDGIFTVVTTEVLPSVLAGVVIAAILAVAMLSTNCVILSMGASFARDFHNKFLHPEVDNLDDLPKSKLVSQATVFVGSLVGIFLAFRITDILDAAIIFNYPYMGSFLIPLLGGSMWKGTTRKGAFTAATAGSIVGVVFLLFGIPGPLYGKMDTGLSLMIAYLISAAFLILFSMANREAKD